VVTPLCFMHRPNHHGGMMAGRTIMLRFPGQRILREKIQGPLDRWLDGAIAVVLRRRGDRSQRNQHRE
jgi:hypothetical protein